jgi:hypothetical protein
MDGIGRNNPSFYNMILYYTTIPFGGAIEFIFAQTFIVEPNKSSVFGGY